MQVTGTTAQNQHWLIWKQKPKPVKSVLETAGREYQRTKQCFVLWEDLNSWSYLGRKQEEKHRNGGTVLPHLQPIVTPSSIANSAKCFERLVAILVGLDWVRIPRSKADKPSQKIHTQRKNLLNQHFLYLTWSSYILRKMIKNPSSKLFRTFRIIQVFRKERLKTMKLSLKRTIWRISSEVQKQLPFV